MTHSVPTRRSSDLEKREQAARRRDAVEQTFILQGKNHSPSFHISRFEQDRPTSEFHLVGCRRGRGSLVAGGEGGFDLRSEEHTSELQSLMRISYAVFCLKKQHTSKYEIAMC